VQFGAFYSPLGLGAATAAPTVSTRVSARAVPTSTIATMKSSPAPHAAHGSAPRSFASFPPGTSVRHTATGPSSVRAPTSTFSPRDSIDMHMPTCPPGSSLDASGQCVQVIHRQADCPPGSAWDTASGQCAALAATGPGPAASFPWVWVLGGMGVAGLLAWMLLGRKG